MTRAKLYVAPNRVNRRFKHAEDTFGSKRRLFTLVITPVDLQLQVVFLRHYDARGGSN